MNSDILPCVAAKCDSEKHLDSTKLKLCRVLLFYLGYCLLFVSRSDKLNIGDNDNTNPCAELLFTVSNATTSMTATRETPCFAIYTRLYPWRGVLLAVSVILLWLFGDNIELPRADIFSKSSSNHHHHLPPSNNAARCLDSDDPEGWKADTCPCSDPIQAKQKRTELWQKHHERLVAAARFASRQFTGNDLDVLFMGDSITERWNGTRYLGLQGPFPEYRAVFEQAFDKEKNPGASLQGVVLGSSGDTTNHLLWHLQNGILPDALKPSVILLLIGTNNLGKDKCSKRSTLSGILKVLRELQSARPDTPVLLHGLLPRREQHAPEFDLGRLWRNIQWINGELKRFCEIQANCYYMEASDMFLVRHTATGVPQKVNKTLMTDGLHPNEEGYRVWAPRIVEQVQKLLPVNWTLCLDSDAPADKPNDCSCSDPTQATPSDTLWQSHHDRLVVAAETASQHFIQNDLDVLLIGDSITERWTGTRHMGERGPYPEYRAVFEQTFDKATHPEAPLQGVALGSSGDTTNHLLWHLQNGMLPDDLNPSVLFLLIGTNNLGRDRCSKQSTLSGITQVVDLLQQARPETPVLLHGLLPRNDNWQGDDAHDFSLGRLWQSIQWINVGLESFCRARDNCFYMETTDMFLQTNAGESIVNSNLMTDALHPNEQGYRSWAPLIAEQVQQLLRSPLAGANP